MIDNLKTQFKGLLGDENPLGKIFSTEKDPISGPLEQFSEMADSIVGIGKNAVLELAKNVGLPSIQEMVNEMQAEFQAADIVCDKIGGQSITIPNILGASAKICLAKKQLGWAIRPDNLMNTGKIALSCGIEELVTEPVDFVLGLGKIIQSGDYEQLSGWFTGLLSGEALPIAHPIQLLTLPAQFAACVQTKIAVEQGDITKSELTKMTKDIYSETGRETGLARNLLKNVGL